jgi:hypothetical protein
MAHAKKVQRADHRNEIWNAVAGIRALRSKIAKRKGFRALKEGEIKSAINERRQTVLVAKRRYT